MMRASGVDTGSSEKHLAISTVTLTRKQIEILRCVAGVRTALHVSGDGKVSHSVSSVLRELLEEARPRLEDELARAGFPVTRDSTRDDE
jgi:hypothetical protein